MDLSLDEKTKICYEAVVDKKAIDVVILDLKGRTSFTDCFLICSGSSVKQVQSIADEIIERLGEKGIKGVNMEGYQTGRWILVDCFDVVVHIFHEESRSYYDIERLWGDAPDVSIAINN